MLCGQSVWVYIHTDQDGEVCVLLGEFEEGYGCFPRDWRMMKELRLLDNRIVYVA